MGRDKDVAKFMSDKECIRMHDRYIHVWGNMRAMSMYEGAENMAIYEELEIGLYKWRREEIFEDISKTMWQKLVRRKISVKNSLSLV